MEAEINQQDSARPRITAKEIGAAVIGAGCFAIGISLGASGIEDMFDTSFIPKDIYNAAFGSGMLSLVVGGTLMSSDPRRQK